VGNRPAVGGVVMSGRDWTKVSPELDTVPAVGDVGAGLLLHYYIAAHTRTVRVLLHPGRLCSRRLKFGITPC